MPDTPIVTAAVPVAISAMTGRENLSGTPALPSVITTAHSAT
jgi:hypothetical protein